MKRLPCLLLLMFAFCLARAQAPWPEKPVRIIVPGGAGGVVDLRARWLADRLARAIGQPVVVEDHPGAGGNVGMRVGAKARADGYTLLMVHQGTMAVNPHMYADPGYDPLRDFLPLTRVGYGPLMLVVNPALPVASVHDLVKLARSKPISYGSPGIGTPPHLAGELFKREAEIRATHVPYKGGGQEVADLIGGHIDFVIDGLTLVGPHANAGRLRALAVTGRERVRAFPEVPTLRESGMPDYDFSGWVGIVAPAATPKAVADKAHAVIARVLASDEAREWFGQAGADSTPDSPERFAAFVREEYVRWGRIVRDTGMRAE